MKTFKQHLIEGSGYSSTEQGYEDYDTSPHMENAVDALKKQGAQKVYAYISHPVLSGSAVEKISKSKLDSLIVTDTIPLSKEAENCKKIKIVSMDSTLAGAITRVNREESISEMFL